MRTQASALAGELDRLYNEIDKIYHELARSSGVSDCAYWLVYALAEADGPLTQRVLASLWSYPKQTVNSALKALEAKGLVRIELETGSRKSTIVALTDAGRSFAQTHIAPTMRAEEQAFEALDTAERTTLVALLRRYTTALGEEAHRTIGGTA